MTHQQDLALAGVVLQTLVSGTLPPDAVGVEPTALLRIAEKNEAFLRVAAALRVAGVPLDPALSGRVDAEIERVRDALRTANEVARQCTAAGIPFLFPKVLQNHPDLGDDIDLLVLADPGQFAADVASNLPVVSRRRSLASRFAGSEEYMLQGCSTPLDVQHGRLGRLGEHRNFPAWLIAHRRPVSVEGHSFDAPSATDHLVLQGMQRVYGRKTLTLSDLAYAIRSVRRDKLDWDDVLRVAHAHGVIGGLGCYLTYVEAVHEAIMGAPLLPSAVRESLPMRGWGNVEFRDGCYRYPAARVAGTLYLFQFGAHVRARRWRTAGRLCLIPVAGAAAIARRVSGAVTPSHTAGHA